MEKSVNSSTCRSCTPPADICSPGIIATLDFHELYLPHVVFMDFKFNLLVFLVFTFPFTHQS
jgi:hypothetical protein